MFDRKYLRVAVAEKYGWEPAKAERPSHPKKPELPQTVTASPEPEHSQPAPAQRKWWKLW